MVVFHKIICLPLQSDEYHKCNHNGRIIYVPLTKPEYFVREDFSEDDLETVEKPDETSNTDKLPPAVILKEIKGILYLTAAIILGIAFLILILHSDNGSSSMNPQPIQSANGDFQNLPSDCIIEIWKIWGITHIKITPPANHDNNANQRIPDPT